MIHRTAIIHAGAQVHPSVAVGAFAVIDEHVSLGEGCVLMPRVHITGHTRIGRGNTFHPGAVIGDEPQDLKYQGAPSHVWIGDDNQFRECTTVHRPAKEEGETRIGDRNVFMSHSHVGHDSRIGNDVTLVNGSRLGGHVVVENRAYLSGGAMVHQFIRIGELSIAQGGAGISQDLPPFTVARAGLNILCGLNTAGLRREGFSSEERLELRRLYHVLFRSDASQQDLLKVASDRFHSPRARQMIEFVAASQRGVCSESPRKNRHTGSG